MTSSFRGGLLLAGLALAAGCNKSEAATTQQRPSQLQGEGGGARVETENYVAYLRTVGTYTKDTEGTFEVVLEAKGDYHINDQYPHKFVPKAGDGVTYKGPAGREGGEFSASKAVLRVPFTPNKSGSVTVSGKLHTSVCSDKNCLMEKPELALSVTVK